MQRGCGRGSENRRPPRYETLDRILRRIVGTAKEEKREKEETGVHASFESSVGCSPFQSLCIILSNITKIIRKYEFIDIETKALLNERKNIKYDKYDKLKI